MAKENEGERSEQPHVVVRRRADRRPPGRGRTATYDDKFRRMLLVVAGMVFEPSVSIPPSLVAQARATFLALVAAEFGDELNTAETVSRETLEDDTWPDSDDSEDVPF